jgi:hypothetical protein
MHIVGITNLVIEMDVQYVRGMLSNPDVQLNAQSIVGLLPSSSLTSSSSMSLLRSTTALMVSQGANQSQAKMMAKVTLRSGSTISSPSAYGSTHGPNTAQHTPAARRKFFRPPRE